jgi:hypothetical protein
MSGSIDSTNTTAFLADSLVQIRAWRSAADDPKPPGLRIRAKGRRIGIL